MEEKRKYKFQKIQEFKRKQIKTMKNETFQSLAEIAKKKALDSKNGDKTFCGVGELNRYNNFYYKNVSSIIVSHLAQIMKLEKLVIYKYSCMFAKSVSHLCRFSRHKTLNHFILNCSNW